MAKTKSKSKPKEKKYVSPWKMTKENLGHYVEYAHRGGGWNPPLDFSKLEERKAKVPGMGAPWLTPEKIKQQQKEGK